jgi:apolipoprotein N-acyltransferase
MRPTKWSSSAAAVFSGLLFALAFPPLEWVVLLPVALVPWLVALTREESRGRAFFSGVLFGFAYWCASIPWVFYVVTHYGGQSAVMGVVCLLLLAGILSEWSAIVTWGTVAVAPAGSLTRLAAFPLLWMAAEHARSYIYGGFPWNLTGHALYRHPIWTQSASVWGVYGVGVCVAAVAALLAATILRRRAAPALVAAGIALLLGAGGAARLRSSSGPARTFSYAILQPNVTEETRRAPGGLAAAYESLLVQAREAARDRPFLIVLPESALPVTWQESERLRRDLAAVSDDCCNVLFNDLEAEPGGRYYNVARLLGPKGLIGRPYRKVHLVPFGEYVPLPKVFFFARKITSEVGGFSAALRPEPIDAGELRIGMGVCYEIIYPTLMRDQVAAGANLLATISNDSWYGRAGAQAQHFAGAAIRSVETNRWLLRAAITGISGAVDERGRIRAELPADQAGILRGQARLLTGQTAWTRWGYWIPRAADVLALTVLLFGAARWWRHRSGKL